MKNICIGTAQFGMDYGISNATGQTKISEVAKIIDCALSNDILYFDTANTYGNSEKILGEVFSGINDTSKIRCLTKIDPNSVGSYKQIGDLIDKSLLNLNLDKLWGLLLHRTKLNGSWKELFNSINELKSKGIIENFGVSTYSAFEAVEFAKMENIDIIQVPFNILDKRLIENNFFKIAKESGKTIFARSIFLQGLFFMDEESLKDKNMHWAYKYTSLLKKYIRSINADVNDFSIQAVKSKLSDSIIIWGVENKAQLEENLNSYNKTNISNTEINNWWKNLEVLPTKLLNPAQW